MVFPLKDENPTEIKPILTVSLIIANVAIFAACLLSGVFGDIVKSYGMKPKVLLSGQELHTLFTSMFLHGGFLHLIGNMWYLWIFGDNIEDACGRARFILLYLICGLIAALAHTLYSPGSMIPTIGASGAISGVLGAYVVLYPRARVYTLIPFYIFYAVKIPAIAFIGFWFVLQVLSASLLVVAGVTATVAYLAHIGGFLAGIALIYPLKKK
jgi:membrane associated rhomboid family serine protease